MSEAPKNADKIKKYLKYLMIFVNPQKKKNKGGTMNIGLI